MQQIAALLNMVFLKYKYWFAMFNDRLEVIDCCSLERMNTTLIPLKLQLYFHQNILQVTSYNDGELHTTTNMITLPELCYVKNNPSLQKWVEYKTSTKPYISSMCSFSFTLSCKILICNSLYDGCFLLELMLTHFFLPGLSTNFSKTQHSIPNQSIINYPITSSPLPPPLTLP